MLLLKDAIKFYEKTYLSEGGKVPTLAEIKAFEACEKALHKLIRRMRAKRRRG